MLAATVRDAETTPVLPEGASRFALDADLASAGLIVTYGDGSTSKPVASQYIYFHGPTNSHQTLYFGGHHLSELHGLAVTNLDAFTRGKSAVAVAHRLAWFGVFEGELMQVGGAPNDSLGDPVVCWVPVAAQQSEGVVANDNDANENDVLAGYERYSIADWDSYGAEPITAATLRAARLLLRILPSSLGRPDVAPGADGTIGFEWAFTDRPLRKLFIDVGPGNVWSGYWRLASGTKQTIRPTPFAADTRATLEKLFNNLSA